MGLSALDIRRDDFVGRKLREIHQKYIYESTLKAGQNNPFLVSVQNIFEYDFSTKTLRYPCHEVKFQKIGRVIKEKDREFKLKIQDSKCIYNSIFKVFVG